MSEEHDLEPLGDLARRAVDAERSRPASVDAANARSRDALFGRVLTTVGVATATSAALAGAASAAKAAPPASATAGFAGATTVTSSAAGAVVSAKAAIAIAVVAFAVGTGTGVVLHSAPPAAPAASAPIETVAVPQPSAPVIAAPLVSTAPSASASAASSSSASPSVAMRAPSTSEASSDADLAAERALVDRARTALARGDTAACLDATAAHEKRFPAGRLAEERELIAISALTRDGRTDEADARADHFRKKYPNSVLTDAVDRVSPPK